MSGIHLTFTVLFGAVCAVGLVAACESNGDDDQEQTADDDAATLDCDSAYHYLYEECDIQLTGEDEQPIAVDTLVTWCESNENQFAAYHEEIFDCIRDHYGVCEDVQACFDDLPQ